MRPEVRIRSRATTRPEAAVARHLELDGAAPSTSGTRVQSVIPLGVGSPEITPSVKRPPRSVGLRCGRPANAAPCPTADATTTPPAAARKLRRDTASPAGQGAARLPVAAVMRHCPKIKVRALRRSGRDTRRGCSSTFST